MAGHDEQGLITSAQQGNLDSFNELVLQYQDSVFSVAYRIMGDEDSAADAAQDAFITAFRRLETYQGGNFRAWLMRVTTNTCYDTLRYHKRRPATHFEDMVSEEYDDGPPIPDESETPEEVVQTHELSNAIQNCISGLSDDQRVVLVMNDIEGFSYQEIADTVGTQLGTVKSRLSRARKALRQCLQGFKELLPAEYRLMSED